MGKHRLASDARWLATPPVLCGAPGCLAGGKPGLGKPGLGGTWLRAAANIPSAHGTGGDADWLAVWPEPGGIERLSETPLTRSASGRVRRRRLRPDHQPGCHCQYPGPCAATNGRLAGHAAPALLARPWLTETCRRKACGGEAQHRERTRGAAPCPCPSLIRAARVSLSGSIPFTRERSRVRSFVLPPFWPIKFAA